MAADAVGLRFDQRRSFTAPGSFDGIERSLRDLPEIVAVDDHARHGIGARPICHVRHRGRALGRGRHAVAVVLAHEDHRQLPHRGHVERLVKGALVVGAVAKERDHHIVGFAPLGRQRRADRDRDAAADDAVRPEVAL